MKALKALEFKDYSKKKFEKDDSNRGFLDIMDEILRGIKLPYVTYRRTTVVF